MLCNFICGLRGAILLYFVFGVLAFSSPIQAKPINHSVLMEYVKYDDGVYDIDLLMTIPNAGFTVYVYKLTSQKWRSENEVDRTVWEHRLTVVVPDNIQSKKSLLFTFGGENNADYLKPDSSRIEILATFALASGTITAQVSQVPNQPLVFFDEPSTGRYEDDLVAYSWDTAMGTRDYTWAAYLPMTKSVIKAINGIQQAIHDIDPNVVPDGFVIVGYSKRGAIAWLSAAVDQRIIAISPGVFDSLNFDESLEHQRKTYGSFSLPLIEYDQRNVLDRIRTIEGYELIQVVDPYSYRHFIDIPKYIINASGDQFYPPDSSRFYINKLSGETRQRYLPNTDHGGINGGLERALLGILSWYQRIVSDAPRPEVISNLDGNGNLNVHINTVQATALLWMAENKNARDFRYETIGPSWQSFPIAIDINGNISANLNVPDTGWAAYYIEVMFPGVAGIPDIYTTPVYILPDVTSYSLEQPVSSPLSKSIWKDRLNDIILGNESNQYLVDSFPIRAIGNDSVSNIETAYALLSKKHVSSQVAAKQECLVTRLNIKDNRIDWYSKNNSHQYLFQLWNLSNIFYHHRFYWGSENICKFLNR